MILGAFTGDSVVLANRQRQLAESDLVRPTNILVELIKVLYRALAKGLLPDDHTARIVLNCRCEDFRG